MADARFWTGWQAADFLADEVMPDAHLEWLKAFGFLSSEAEKGRIKVWGQPHDSKAGRIPGEDWAYLAIDPFPLNGSPGEVSAIPKRGKGWPGPSYYEATWSELRFEPREIKRAVDDFREWLGLPSEEPPAAGKRRPKRGRRAGRYARHLPKILGWLKQNQPELLDGSQTNLHAQVRKMLVDHSAKDVPKSRQALQTQISKYQASLGAAKPRK
jgi:hypothetical protein